ncbi:MAG: hypothetical protein QF614_07490, partial [SAR324 cluster bacterium]|nr:hypothetical protein [SAR324 cluster bacterium]
FWWERLVMAMFAYACLWIVFWMGRILFSESTALLAAGVFGNLEVAVQKGCNVEIFQYRCNRVQVLDGTTKASAGFENHGTAQGQVPCQHVLDHFRNHRKRLVHVGGNRFPNQAVVVFG